MNNYWQTTPNNATNVNLLPAQLLQQKENEIAYLRAELAKKNTELANKDLQIKRLSQQLERESAKNNKKAAPLARGRSETRTTTESASSPANLMASIPEETAVTAAVAKSQKRKSPNHQEATKNKKLATESSKPDTKQPAPTRRKILCKSPGFTDSTWEVQFQSLCDYKMKHGHCSARGRGSVGKFVEKLRKYYKDHQLYRDDVENPLLTKERIRLINDLGFEWETQTSLWDLQFSRLKTYKEKHGTTRVQKSIDPRLHSWTINQRCFYRNSIKAQKNDASVSATNNSGNIDSDKKRRTTMNIERVAKLQMIGFEWDIADKDALSAWEAKFRDLLSFRSQFGHCRVPREYKPNIQLSNWVKEQRKNYKAMNEGKSRKGLTDERIRRLNEVGFAWRIMPLPVDRNNNENQVTEHYSAPVDKPNFKPTTLMRNTETMNC